MKRTFNQYSLELKKEVVAQLETNGLTKTAKQYNIPVSTIVSWPRQLKKKKSISFSQSNTVDEQIHSFVEVDTDIINDISTLNSGCNIEISKNGSLIKITDYPPQLINFAQLLNL